MDQRTFHLSSYVGKPSSLIHEPSFGVEAGDVFRLFEGAYGTATVLGISPRTRGDDDVYVRLARPYCYASSVGTTGPTALVGCEIVDVTLQRLVQLYRQYGEKLHGTGMTVKP